MVSKYLSSIVWGAIKFWVFCTIQKKFHENSHNQILELLFSIIAFSLIFLKLLHRYLFDFLKIKFFLKNLPYFFKKDVCVVTNVDTSAAHDF